MIAAVKTYDNATLQRLTSQLNRNKYIAEALGAFALVSGQLESVWIYLTATVPGMLLAVPSCRWVQGTEYCTDETESITPESA